MLYDKIQKECQYGHYNLSSPASYTVTNSKDLVSPWYYIYQNRKILLYVDQNGPVKIQYQPPKGILIIKRDIGETQSKWQQWISSPDLNNGVPVSVFNSPKLAYNGEQPKYTIDWTPTTATYTSVYNGTTVSTVIFVPHDKATVVMKTTVKNTSNKPITYKFTSAMLPYINVPQMVAWDLPEWYLSSKAKKNGNYFTICGQMSDPLMIKENQRSVTVNYDFEDNADFTLDLSVMAKTSNFFNPDCLKDGVLSYKMKDVDTSLPFSSYQAGYATSYDLTLLSNDSKTFTQVLTVQDSFTYNEEENEYDRLYFDDKKYFEKVKNTNEFFTDLFTKRTIKTDNELYNNFINTFAPLQMYWVGSLDRGWPSGMRGTRDASQDFNGVLQLDPKWTREVILETFEHQRTDGWFPRQISIISRTAPHDMRYFSDGGAFFLELIYDYLCYTRDYSILNEEVLWLDSDNKSTVLEHVKRTFDFYLSEKNIGEHGLTKVWYGDWWDVADRIGMDGRGETVCVTAQVVLDLRYFIDVYKFLYNKKILDDSILSLIDEYSRSREKFIQNMRKNAFNKKGFFNGYFNDNGKWLFSDQDPDGVDKCFIVANSWAIISGVATPEMSKSVLEYICKNDKHPVNGYNTASTGFKQYVDKAGRVGNGSRPTIGTYNHAQSFLVRAACASSNSQLAYDISRYIYPFEESYRPVEKTFAPPFCIANGYSCSSSNTHRVELQYLSGTVSYVLRNVYSFIFGITYCIDGLMLKPCIPAEFGNCEVDFSFLNKKFKIEYVKTANTEKTVKLNGKVWTKTKYSVENYKDCIFISDEDMLSDNQIYFEY